MTKTPTSADQRNWSVPARNRPRSSRGVPAATFARLTALETDECILWPHAKSRKGYGSLSVDGCPRRVYVLACELRHGPRPEGMEAAHSCGVPACLNYRHLRWATQSENMMDRVAHGSSNRGERCGAHRLAEVEVLAVRVRLASGESQIAVAASLNVHPGTIQAIASGRSWAWL